MLLRGVAAHRLTSSVTFVLAVIVVAGSVVVSGFGRLAHVSAASTAVLIVLGAVAISAQAAEVARRRGPEVAVARLRGLHGARLGWFVVGEQVAVAVAGGLVGVGLGDLLARWAIRAWISGAPAFGLGSREWAAAAVVVVVAVAAIVASSWGSARRPLATALAADRRPGQRSVLLVSAELLLVVAAVVALYEARQPISAAHDWVPLASPVVVGLAAGQVAVWLLTGLLAALRRRSGRGQALSWFLTVRRLGRRASSTGGVRTVIAAGVVLAVAFCAVVAAAEWRSDRARLQAGAPLRFPVRQGALRAYALADAADPAGRWLMPVVTYNSSDPGGRRVFVDADRWNAVASGFFAGTVADGVSSQIDRLAASPGFRLLKGDDLMVSLTAASQRRLIGFKIVVQYVLQDGNLGFARVAVPTDKLLPTHDGLITLRGTVHGCNDGCSLSNVQVDGYTDGPVDVTAIDFGDTSLLAPSTGGHVFTSATDKRDMTVRRQGTGLVIDSPRTSYEVEKTLVGFVPRGRTPAVATRTASFADADGVRAVEGIDGSPRPIDVVTRLAALPFVGTRGTLLDLRSMLSGAGATIPGTHAFVLARADTPLTVLRELKADGVGPVQTYSHRLSALDATPRAQGTRLYSIVAVSAGVIALVFLVAGIAAQVDERRREAASLRVVGVPASVVSSAYRREALTVGLATFIGTTLASWVACRGLLSRLPLVSGWAFAPPLDSSARPLVILAVAAGVSAAAGLLLLAGYARVGTASPPRILREGAQ